ncbi:MAG: Cell division organizing protein PopZ [Pseudolabrys sp.]|jgi:cell pole-organizing protein PopZ|nr:Cell division organizing protein PopZ [Pseudolabrys sp.]
MEEILASIRRIIADDEAAKPARPEPAPSPPVAVAPPPPPPAAPPPPRPAPAPVAEFRAPPPPLPEPPPAADVLDLTEAMAASSPPTPPAAPPAFRTIDAQSDVVFADRPLESEPAVRVVEEARRQFEQAAPDRSLLSTTTAAAVDSAFNSLAHTVLGTNARTLEDLVKEMLRPMLKAWLDDNLPSLVERIVRAEIERVSRGHG